ncbi:MAG TPA: DUF1697 domain-containing protein [Myxococcales bacterium]|nr:DUF1697 domain-containing protein [Myxococcales bacterium]
MPRYAAFLRGVMPMNAKMPELKRRFEKAGFTEVSTLLSSGNVVFTARAEPDEREVSEVAGFGAFVRSIDELRALVDGDPFAAHPTPANGKRVVTFLRAAPADRPALPLALHGASILALYGAEAISFYTPGPHGPVFMTLIEKTFGRDVTTRTWDTVRKVTLAGSAASPGPKGTASPRRASTRPKASRRKRAGGRRRG